ncbi:MAG: DinB family protein [Cyclobacteriaceae bacterium]|nr:DinB family protein [Cyclobacteriaceae bacterium]
MMKKFRNNGAIGALLDEYEKAILEIKEITGSLTDHELKQIVDKETKDPDCVSIQSILGHVIRAGYNYVIVIRKSLGEQIEYRTAPAFDTKEEYRNELGEMFKYNEKLFSDYPDIQLEQYEEAKKIPVRWGQKYDVEQLFEHAIVHLLRHRRQIERFMIRIRGAEER